MKAILEFNLPEEKHDFDVANKAYDYKIAIEDIYTNVFRPAFKHGYSNPEIQEHLEKYPESYKLIEMLHTLYIEVLNDNKVND